MKLHIAIVGLLLCASAFSAQKTASIQFFLPFEDNERATTDATVRSALTFAREGCRKASQSAYIENLTVGPVASSYRDGVSLQYQCVPSNDPRLSEPGRSAEKQDSPPTIVVLDKVQPPSPITGWDITYQRVFDEFKISERDTMRKYFRDSALNAAYAHDFLLDANFFKDAPHQMDAAVLIDYTAFYYMGYRLTQFSFASNDKAESRSFNSRNRDITTKPMQADLVRRQAQALMDFKTSSPPPVKPYPYNGAADGEFVQSGFIGVVSVLLDGKVRQFPITGDDIMQKGAGRSAHPGRLARMLRELQMTPEERSKAIAETKQREQNLPLLNAAEKADIPAIRKLVENGIDVNFEMDGTTPLIEATRSDNIDVVNVLLQAGANANHVTAKGESALDSAVGRGSLSITETLMQNGASINSGGYRPLSSAVRWNRLDLFKVPDRGSVNPSPLGDG